MLSYAWSRQASKVSFETSDWATNGWSKSGNLRIVSFDKTCLIWGVDTVINCIQPVVPTAQEWATITLGRILTALVWFQKQRELECQPMPNVTAALGI